MISRKKLLRCDDLDFHFIIHFNENARVNALKIIENLPISLYA